MATYTKFQQFVEDIGSGVHDLRASGDTCNVYLSNATPSVSADAVKTDLAEISTGNGYTGPEDIQNTYTESGGTATFGGTDVVITASGGTVGPLRYAVIYNDTPTSPADPLIAYYDYGSEITLQDGESLTIDFGASIFTYS